MNQRSVEVVDMRRDCEMCALDYAQKFSVGLCACGKEEGRFRTYHNGGEAHHGFIGANCEQYVDKIYLARID